MPKIMKRINNLARAQAVYRTRECEGGAAGELPSHLYTFVLAVSRMPGSSQEELATDLCLNKSTASRALSSLERDGYVRREASSTDRRRILVYPTDKMLACLDDVRRATAAWCALITEGIAEEDMRLFESVLIKMEKNARTYIGGEG